NRKNDDRYIRPRSYGLEDFESAHARQAEIKNDHVWPQVGNGVQPRRSIFGLANRIAIKLQTRANESPDLWFVVDHQDRVSRLAHCSTAPRPAQCLEGLEGESTLWFLVRVPRCERKVYRH